MADVTFWAFGAGLAGIILIFLTWIATKQAVVASKDNAKDQTRAYVFVDEATFSMRTSGKCIMLSVKNTGATPAKWFEVGSKSAAIPTGDELGADFTTIQNFTRWPAIANGHHLTTGADPLTEAQHIAKVVGDNKLTFYIYGIIRYMTAYDEVFESQFAFFHSGATVFRESTLDNGDKKFVHVALSRPPINLEVYKNVTKQYKT